MKVENLELTLLKIVNKNGIGKKSGNPYNFDVASVVDEDANVFDLNLSDSVSAALTDEVRSLRNVAIEATVEFKPKDYALSGTLLEFRPV